MSVDAQKLELITWISYLTKIEQNAATCYPCE